MFIKSCNLITQVEGMDGAWQVAGGIRWAQLGRATAESPFRHCRNMTILVGVSQMVGSPKVLFQLVEILLPWSATNCPIVSMIGSLRIIFSIGHTVVHSWFCQFLYGAGNERFGNWTRNLGSSSKEIWLCICAKSWLIRSMVLPWLFTTVTMRFNQTSCFSSLVRLTFIVASW